MAYIFLFLCIFFISNVSLSICICICLTRSVEYPHGWDYAWDNSWISNLDTPLSHYPLPISRFIHQVWGFLDFALWISRPTDNRYTTQRSEQLQHPGYFKVSPDICTYKDDKKNARDALLLRTVHIYPWLAPVWPAIADVTQEAPTCLSLVFPTHSTACRSNPCPLLRISKHVNPLF